MILKNVRWLSVLLAVALILSGTASPGRAQVRGDEYSDPNLEPEFHSLPANIEILRLENGLEVILMRNPAQPMVGIYTQVKVGSAREDFRTSGMSHMLEHLLFNGSEKYTQEELYDLADNAGAYNNANTTDFYTNYMMVIPAAEIETEVRGIPHQTMLRSITKYALAVITIVAKERRETHGTLDLLHHRWIQQPILLLDLQRHSGQHRPHGVDG